VDDHGYYKVEKWTRDGAKVDNMLYAGNNLIKAQAVFCCGGKAPATDQTDYSATDSRVAGVAATAALIALSKRNGDKTWYV
jgi:hypothetical protein